MHVVVYNSETTCTFSLVFLVYLVLTIDQSFSMNDQGYSRGYPPIFTTWLEPLARVTLYLAYQNTLGGEFWRKRS